MNGIYLWYDIHIGSSTRRIELVGRGGDCSGYAYIWFVIQVSIDIQLSIS